MSWQSPKYDYPKYDYFHNAITFQIWSLSKSFWLKNYRAVHGERLRNRLSSCKRCRCWVIVRRNHGNFWCSVGTPEFWTLPVDGITTAFPWVYSYYIAWYIASDTKKSPQKSLRTSTTTWLVLRRKWLRWNIDEPWEVFNIVRRHLKGCQDKNLPHPYSLEN